MASQNFDVCVVGAGAAGAIVSYLLTRKGWKVLLIEAGRRFDDAERYQKARDLLNFGKKPWPGMLPERDKYISTGEITYNLNTTRVFGVGGSTLHWGGIANRLHADDFAERSNYGVGADWPVPYDELEPFYVQAEWLIGVAGPNNSPFSSPRSADYPMREFPLGYTDQYWKEVCRRAGVTIHPTAYAKNSVPYDGRPACSAFGTCIPICPIKAQYSADHHVIKALETGNLSLLTETYVRRIITDRQGKRGTGVLTTDLAGNDRIYKADAYIIAAHAVESARLLLLSANHVYPNGLGNQGDQVGRNFMEHWYIHGSAKIKDRRFYPNRIGFDPAESHQFYSRKDRSEAGAIKLEFSDRGPTPYGIAIITGLRGKALTRKIEAEFGRTIAISAETEHLPYSESRIYLHKSEVNIFDDPIPAIHLHLGEYERETQRRASQIIARILDATGSDEINLESWEKTPGWASHHLGTCRMGVDPTTSVVDPNLRIHGLKNIYVVGSAVFPTGGAAQPTLTIAALAIRLADHLSNHR